MRCVALVRNVMLGREGLHRELLVRLVEDAGGGDVVSVLTTGNLLFTMPSEAVDPVISQLEADIAVVLGRTEPVVVRTLDWLRSFVQHDPFTAEQHADAECEVAFLHHRAAPLDPSRIPFPGRTTVVAVRTRELVTARPRTGNNRPHVNRLLERATGQPATARGWGTLRRIASR